MFHKRLPYLLFLYFHFFSFLEKLTYDKTFVTFSAIDPVIFLISYIYIFLIFNTRKINHVKTKHTSLIIICIIIIDINGYLSLPKESIWFSFRWENITYRMKCVMQILSWLKKLFNYVSSFITQLFDMSFFYDHCFFFKFMLQ